ncbi:MAG: hypothetical protein ACE5G1_13600 [bacterium]
MFVKLVFTVFLVTTVAIIENCTSTKNSTPTADSTMLEKIYVDEIDSKGTVAGSEKLDLTIRGNLPSPAYTFERFDVKVDGKTIKVTPLARYDSSKLVAQMLVPFENICTVENLKAGTYEVRVYGRGDKVVSSKNIDVKNQ